MKSPLLVLLTALYLTACDGGSSGDSRFSAIIGAANPDIAGDTQTVSNPPAVVENTGDNSSSALPVAVITEEEVTDVVLNPPTTNINGEGSDIGLAEETDISTEETVNVPNPNSRISGNITLLNDAFPVGEITVKVRDTDSSATIQENGDFSIELPVSDNDRTVVLDIRGDAIVEKGIEIHIPAEAELVVADGVIGSRTPPITFNLEIGGELQNEDGTSGTSVSLPANAFEFADGTLALGNAQVSITEIDIQDLEGDSAWAPSLIGLAEGSVEPSALLSYGMADYTFTQDGQEIRLREDMQATLRMHMPVTANSDIYPEQASVGDVIPLWYYDDEAMIWVEDGVASVVADSESPSGLSWTGQVSHFTTWNSDAIRGTGTINVNVEVVDQNGQPITGITVDGYKAKMKASNITSQASYGYKAMTPTSNSQTVAALWNGNTAHYDVTVKNITATGLGTISSGPLTATASITAGSTDTATVRVVLDIGPYEMIANVKLIAVNELGQTLDNVTIERYRATANSVGTSWTNSANLTPASTELRVQGNTQTAVNIGVAVATRVSVDNIVISNAVSGDIISYPGAQTRLFKTYEFVSRPSVRRDLLIDDEEGNTLTFKIVIKTTPTVLTGDINVILVDFQDQEIRGVDLHSYTITTQAAGSSTARNVQNFTSRPGQMSMQGNTRLLINMGKTVTTEVSISNIVIEEPYRVFAVPDSQSIVLKTFADNTVTFRVVTIPQ